MWTEGYFWVVVGERGGWEFRKGLLSLFGGRREVSGGDSMPIDA